MVAIHTGNQSTSCQDSVTSTKMVTIPRFFSCFLLLWISKIWIGVLEQLLCSFSSWFYLEAHSVSELVAASDLYFVQLLYLWESTSKGQRSTSRSQEMVLATRGNHDRTHGHAMVLRWKRTLPLTDWQHQQCHRKGTKREECIKKWERENFCWEKFPFMVEPFLVRLVCDSLYCPWCLRAEWKYQRMSCLRADELLYTWFVAGLLTTSTLQMQTFPHVQLSHSFPRIICWTPKSLLTWSCCLVGIHWHICDLWHSFTLICAQTMRFKLMSTISTRLDADAALVRHHVDILGGIAQQMPLGADKTCNFNWGSRKIDNLFNSLFHASEGFG